MNKQIDMADNLQKPSGARSASEALSKMKENRQQQTSTTQSTQTSRPTITQNVVHQNSSNNSDDTGCGEIVFFVICFIVGFLICSML